MPPGCELMTPRAELHQLRQLQGSLSTDLERHASQLKRVGALPPDELLDQLIAFRIRLIKLTETAQISPQAAASLDHIQIAIQRDEAQGTLQQTLARIASLRHQDDPTFPGLQTCQAAAAAMSSSIHGECGPQISTAEALMPFNALLQLVDSPGQLTDDAWAACREQILNTWGTGLATAVVRGKIESVAPHAIVPEVFDLDRVEPVSQPFICDAEFGPPTLEIANEDQQTHTNWTRLPLANSETSRTDGTLISAPIPSAVVSLSGFTPSSISSLARDVLQAAPANRRAMVSQITLQLLWEDRAALAYHLTRSSEKLLLGHAYVLPSWVMHALALSRHLCYSQGEIARLLEEDLKQFKPELLHASSPEWNAGTGFFLRAAALIPALLASSPAAATILRTFRITPGLTHLYNYCSRVLTYGQQLHGQAADLFTPDCDLANWEREIGDLRQTVETWLPETIRTHSDAQRSSLLFLTAHWTLTGSPSVRYPEAARIWSKWQEVFRIVSRLLKPIRAGQETERNWVKSEIDRLTHSVQLETVASDGAPAPILGALTFPHERMLDTIREAIEFASHWLRLCASKPAQGRTLASRDAEILRDEILDRTDGVITELASYSRTDSTPRSQAGIACLNRSIEHLRAIFTPQSTLALRETDPRELINGVLLKIPDLQFNDQGLPIGDPAALESAVLTFLSQEPRARRSGSNDVSTAGTRTALIN